MKLEVTEMRGVLQAELLQVYDAHTAYEWLLCFLTPIQVLVTIVTRGSADK